MSFVNQEDTKQLLCRSCHNIAHNAMLLDCSLKHHKKQNTLYCSKCALLFIDNYKKCPFNHHLHPIFKPATQQRLVMNEFDVICPYSTNELIAKEHNSNDNDDDKKDQLFLYDTDHGHIASEADHRHADHEGTHKINNNNNNNNDDGSSSLDSDIDIGCEWIGKYKYLSYHIENECKFIPIQQQISRIKTHFEALKNVQIKNKVNKSFLSFWILLNIIVIMIFSGIFVWFWMEIKDIKCNNIDSINNEFDINKINKYIDDKFDDLMDGKYQNMDGYFHILKGDLNAFKIEIMDSIASQLKNEDFIQKNDESVGGETKYYAIFDDILTNAKSKYDGYKKQIDGMPLVQFVSNTVNKLKEKKEI